MKRILALMLVVMMFAAVMSIPAFAAEEVTSLAGDGSSENPYLISSLADLEYFRDSVNAGNDYKGKYFSLTSDIDMASVENWVPIGLNGSHANNYTFRGYLNGNNKTISNLTITDTTDVSDKLGLFGHIHGGGMQSTTEPSVKNLKLENVNISSTDNKSRIGCLAGNPYTCKLENITVSGSVSGGKWSGGIAGNCYTYFENCHFTGDVTSNNQAGGIAGAGDARVYNSSSIGNITAKWWAGGIIGNGQEGSSAENCYAKGTVKTLYNYIHGTGGIAGMAGHYEACSYKNNYFDGEVYIGEVKIDAPVIGVLNGTSETAAAMTVEGNSWNTSYYPADLEISVVGGSELDPDTTEPEIEKYKSVASQTSERNNNLVMLESDLPYIDAADASGVTIMNGSSVTEDKVEKAVEFAAQIGDDKYATLKEAFENAEKGDTITLLRSVTITEQITLADNNVLSDITINGNGKTIKAGKLNQSNTSVLYFGNTSSSIWCTGVKIKDLTIDAETARFGIFLCGGTSSELTNVTVKGDYIYGINLFGTHGADMTNCDIVSVFTNAQDDYPLNLNNTKIGTMTLNSSDKEEDAGKVKINNGSSVDKLYAWGGNTKNVGAGIENVKEIFDGETEAQMVAEAGGIVYLTLKAAADAAESGSTITLVADEKLAGQNCGDMISGHTLDLNDNILTLEGNTYLTDETIIKNGKINVTGKISDSYICLYEADTKLTLDDVELTGEFDAYAVLNGKNTGRLIIKDSLIDVTGNISDSEGMGNIIYGGNVTIDNSTVKGTNTVRGIGLADVEIKNNSVVDISNVETGLNNSTVTIDNSTVTITNATKRAVRLDGDSLTLKNNAALNAVDCAEDIIGIGETGTDKLSVDASSSLNAEADENIVINPWTSITDSGRYILDETTYGFVRFLFNIDTEASVLKAGIKFSIADDITDSTNAEAAKDTDAKSFYGDVTEIPENNTSRIYAKAYVVTEDGTIWSDAISTSVDWAKLFDKID